MKKIDKNNSNSDIEDDIADNYDFDYSQAKPNRFAAILAEQNGFIKLQPDIQNIFQTSDQVNNALRALINAIPHQNK